MMELALMSLRTTLVLLLNLECTSSICPWQKEFSEMNLKLLELLQSLKQVMKMKYGIIGQFQFCLVFQKYEKESCTIDFLNT